jgi:hypothetical protein
MSQTLLSTSSTQTFAENKPVPLIGDVHGQQHVVLRTPDGDSAIDDTNDAIKTVLATTIAGEDVANDVMKTEQRFAYINVAADTAVKSAPGFLHTLTFAQTDAAPTAGSIIVYDNTAESGTKIFEWNITTAVFMPFTVTIDAAFAIGLYVGFTTTADVAVTVSYR